MTSSTTRSTAPDAVAVGFGVLGEVGDGAAVVGEGLGVVLAFGAGAVLLVVLEGVVALGFGAVVRGGFGVVAFGVLAAAVGAFDGAEVGFSPPSPCQSCHRSPLFHRCLAAFAPALGE
ncbi:hypothetical protein ACWEQ1_12220 [Streptomyces nodosus]